MSGAEGGRGRGLAEAGAAEEAPGAAWTVPTERSLGGRGSVERPPPSRAPGLLTAAWPPGRRGRLRSGDGTWTRRPWQGRGPAGCGLHIDMVTVAAEVARPVGAAGGVQPGVGPCTCRPRDGRLVSRGRRSRRPRPGGEASQARDSPETLGGPFGLLHFPAVAATPWRPLAHSRVSLVSVTTRRPSPPGSSRGTASCQDTGRAGVGPSLTASSSLDCKDPVFT